LRDLQLQRASFEGLISKCTSLEALIYIVERICGKGPSAPKLDLPCLFLARCGSLELFVQDISCISWAGSRPWGGASCLCDGALKA